MKNNPENLDKQIEVLAKAINEPENVIVITDFKNTENKDLSEYLKLHLALKKLVDEGKIKSIITENHDGLQRKTGVKSRNLHEINGNDFTEYCIDCKENYVRDFKIQKNVEKSERLCTRCDKPLVYYSEAAKISRHNAAVFRCFVIFIIFIKI